MGVRFAKIFSDVPVVGQVLLKQDTDDDGRPEVRWYAQLPGLGVCSFAVGFADDDKGWAAADRAFNGADRTEAEAAAQALLKASGAGASDD